LTYSELQSEWMAQAIHNATSSSLEEGDLDKTTVVQKLEKMQSVVANQQRGLQDAHSTCRLLHAEKRLLQAEVDEVRKRARHQRPTDTSSQAMQDGLGGEILRMRRALRDVPSDDFPCTYATMIDLMDTCNAPTLQAMVTAGTIRDYHDGRGAHTLDVTESPTSAVAKTVELRVCFANDHVHLRRDHARRAYATNPHVSWYRVQGHERHGNWPPRHHEVPATAAARRSSHVGELCCRTVQPVAQGCTLRY